MAEAESDRTTDEWWRYVQGRAARSDFFYAVTTTGIYCRSGCPSRLPLRKHVRFFASPMAAEAAGYRPCRRCKPSSVTPSPSPSVVQELCRYLQRQDPTPFEQWAFRHGVSGSHLRRLFVRATGLTPKAYRDAVRREQAERMLRSGTSITETVFSSGYAASSRFYAHLSKRLGMPPKQYQKQGEGLWISYATAHCSLGVILVAATSRGLCAVLLADTSEQAVSELYERFGRANVRPADAVEERARLEKVVYFVDATQSDAVLELSLDTRGTVFQERVWQELRKIPRGQTSTYTEVALALGQPRAARAVARACAQNPLAVLTPCHRVVRKDNDLAGYRWGLERKTKLLEREKSK
jgi:AraC family transcriptional regulator, regulatory protein of adaptative response / methylated-DNA-[protein]-cysteine methyltransferase